MSVEGVSTSLWAGQGHQSVGLGVGCDGGWYGRARSSSVICGAPVRSNIDMGDQYAWIGI